jgi:hypothetical protein
MKQRCCLSIGAILSTLVASGSPAFPAGDQELPAYRHRQSRITFIVDQQENTLSLPQGAYLLSYSPRFMGSNTQVVIGTVPGARARRPALTTSLTMCQYPRVAPFSPLTFTDGYQILAAMYGPIPDIHQVIRTRTLNGPWLDRYHQRRGFSMQVSKEWLLPEMRQQKPAWSSYDALNDLSIELYSKNDLIAARVFIEETVQDAPADACASFMMACISDRLGDAAAANLYYGMYRLASDPCFSISVGLSPRQLRQCGHMVPKFKFGFGDKI